MVVPAELCRGGPATGSACSWRNQIVQMPTLSFDNFGALSVAEDVPSGRDTRREDICISSLPRNCSSSATRTVNSGQGGVMRRGGGLSGSPPLHSRSAKGTARTPGRRRAVAICMVVPDQAALASSSDLLPSITERPDCPLTAIFLGFIASGTSRTRSITSRPSSRLAFSTRT